MEDTARLALVEQNVRDMETFSKMLYEILRHISCILENPHDYELRTIKSETLKTYLRYEAFVEYLKSIGFQFVENEYKYPKESTLSNLRMAQAAIERKIHFCCGPLNRAESKLPSIHKLIQSKRPKFIPEAVLKTNNQLLLKIETLFNDVLQYEDEELQALARDHIPIVTLQIMAMDELREHQRKIKTGETEGRDIPFDIALLKVLLSWFKHRFFSWVDAPECEACGGETKHVRNSTLTVDGETCRLEEYKCCVCAGGASFPRHNSPRTLLRTRRGRCGEWANCFALLCRALGYDTRLVFSTADHVWCEIWDYDSNSWLHCDPCEGAIDTPLMYSHGWGKQLSYVIACSRDDLQDVTWRYTTGHKEVLSRRRECDEMTLLWSLIELRMRRQRQVCEARRRYLARRCIMELADLLTERSAAPREAVGRVSGAAAWRGARGELRAGHVFSFTRAGRCRLAYSVVSDRYKVEGGDETEVTTWAAGAYNIENVFRKVEKDWKMVYLAREESWPVGRVSWAVRAARGLVLTSLAVRAASAELRGGRVRWSLQLDDQPPAPAGLTDSVTEFRARCRQVIVRAELSGGSGDVAWQHAQLFRAPLHDTAHQLELTAVAEHE